MSFTLPTGAKAPEFDLPAHDGRNRTFAGLNGSLGIKGAKGSLIFFTCNHCPYVIGSEDRMKTLFNHCAMLGISMTAIHSNETKDHPEDDFDHVKARMREKGFEWISLNDEQQLVARAYGAERTPHYFLFDKSDKLAYSGRMDNSPRNVTKAQTHELVDAIREMISGRPAPEPLTGSIGCNIKWWDKEK